MRGAIAMVTTVCGKALLMTQLLHDGFVQGGPAYCEFMGVDLCLAGLVMGFLVVGRSASGAVGDGAAG